MARNQDTVNAIMAKFYEAITATDSLMGSSHSGQHFVSFAMPGIPVTNADLSFQSSQVQQSVEAASAFADLVNSIPNVQGFWVTTGEKLWDEYKSILIQAKLPSSVLNDAEKQQLEEAMSLLWDGQQQTNLFSQYNTYAESYYEAKLIYNSRLVAVQNNPNDQALQNAWLIEEPTLRSNYLEVHKRWVRSGKHKVEIALNSIEQLSNRNPFMKWNQYKQLFNQAAKTDMMGQRYYETGFANSNFLSEPTSWTKFTMNHQDIEQIDTSHRMRWGGGPDANYKLWQFGRSKYLTDLNAAEEKESKVIDFSLSLEYTRVPLQRTWLISSIFRSRHWRWGFDSADLLSDGIFPPSGKLVAYPTEILIVKDLLLKINLSSGSDADAANLFDQYGTIGWGPFRLRGKTFLQEFKPIIAQKLGLAPPPIDLSYFLSPRLDFNYGLNIDPLVNPSIDPTIDIVINPIFDFDTSGPPIDALFDPNTRSVDHTRIDPVTDPDITPNTNPKINIQPHFRAQPPVNPTLSIDELNELLRNYQFFERTWPVQPHDFIASSSEIRAPGMQIIGFICQLLPRSPNPDQSLSWS